MSREDYYSNRRYDDSDDEDYQRAEKHAAEHSGDSSDLFSKALGMLSGKKQSLKDEELDEEAAVQSHKTLYGGGGSETHQATENNLGMAAAMQALKMFTGGGGEAKSSSKSEFLGLAMAQASKLFDEQSNNGKTDPNASKAGTIQQAAKVALQMYMKSNQSGGTTGENKIMGLASKFL